MGEIKVNGTAKREIKAVAMECNITFTEIGESQSAAITAANKELMNFISIVEKEGFDIGHFKTISNEIEEKYVSNLDQQSYSAERKICIVLPVDKVKPGHLLNVIEENRINASYNESYAFDILNIQNELIQEAVKDSKQKAELIALGAGRTIKGLKTISYGDSYRDYEDVLDDGYKGCFSTGCAKHGDSRISDRIALPTMETKVTVNAIWECED